MRSDRQLITILLSALAITLLAPSASAAGQACYVISNFAPPQYVNITLNGSFFQERLNFVGPTSAGVTINDNSSYTLYPNQSVVIRSTQNYTYTTMLINVSWLPVQHSAVISLCSVSRFNATSSTTTLNTSSSTTSVQAASTTAQSTTILPAQNSIAASNNSAQSSGTVAKPLGRVYWLAAVAIALVVVAAALAAVLLRGKGRRGRPAHVQA